MDEVNKIRELMVTQSIHQALGSVRAAIALCNFSAQLKPLIEAEKLLEEAASK